MSCRGNILLGITGSIAAYKSADIVRRLTEDGFCVKVLMTDAACRFITPYTFETLTGNPVNVDTFRDPLAHIRLSDEAQLLLISPATANTINKLSAGIADNLLTNIWLAFEGRVIIAPAMNSRMFRNPLVQKNIKLLKNMGVQFVGPDKGSLACGDEGIGRMADVSEITEAAVSALTVKDLEGHKIMVTAGPTVEPIDPVRFISNRSSGKMGYAVALAAKRRGADVTLISGPTSLEQPYGVSCISVETAAEMESAVLRHFRNSTAVVMASAVSDFTPAAKAKVKHDKSDLKNLKLQLNTDILKKMGSKKGKKILVGFAAETGKNIERAQKKMKDKNLDIMVFNDVTQKGAGFGSDTNIVTLIGKNGNLTELPLMKKTDVADKILDTIKKLSKKEK